MSSRWVVAALFALAGCSSNEPAPEAEAPFFPEDFRERLTQVRDCRESPAEHDGFFVNVYASRSAARAYTDGVYPFEEGTLLVKGEYDDPDCSELARVSAMRRLPDGSDSSLGDWEWQRTSADFEVLHDTPQKSCAGCHRACEASDFACTDP